MDKSNDFEWETSRIKPFSFDENESTAPTMCGVPLGGTARLSQQIKAGLGYNAPFATTSSRSFDSFGDEYDKNLAPNLSQLISDKSLKTILEADQEDYSFHVSEQISEHEKMIMLRKFYENRWSAPDVNAIINQSLLNRPYCLEMFKSLEQKKELFKRAEESGDGDLILNVVLFLSRTLKKQLFHDLLATSSLFAVDHYVTYLATRNKIQEMKDILELLGRGDEAAIIQFKEACGSPERMHQKLQLLTKEHFAFKDNNFVQEFIKLLEWQKAYDNGRLFGHPLSTTLTDLCTNHWDDPVSSPRNPQTVAASLRASDKLYQWAALEALAKRQKWSVVPSIFMTKGWLQRTKFKMDVPVDALVQRLHQLSAPQSLLVTVLEWESDLERRMTLARRVGCHRAVIDIYKAQKDRLSIVSYKSNFDPISDEFLYAEQVLRDPKQTETEESDDSGPDPLSLVKRRNAIIGDSSMPEAQALLDFQRNLPSGTTDVKKGNSKKKTPK